MTLPSLLRLFLRKPLHFLLPLQAVLLLTRLDLLAPWGDEVFTLEVSARPFAHILGRVAWDIHPPLFFVLQHFWNQIPAPWSDVVQSRLLAAMFALVATPALDRFFLRTLTPEARAWSLSLWCLSPCMLLYGRMARSYSMQMVLALAVFAAAVSCRREPRRAPPWAALAIGLAALLYTHYVPGLVMLAAVNLCLFRVRPAALAVADAVVLAAYAPWLATLSGAVSRWSAQSAYMLSGSAVFEQVLKVGYGVVSFQTGETLWSALLPLALALAVAGVALAAAGAWTRPPWLPLWMIAVPFGYLGVSKWVSYPFIPARMLWLLPLYCVLVASGIAARPRWGRPAGIALLALHAAAIGSYFLRVGYLNRGYAVPYQEIARRIETQPLAGDVLLLVDCCNADLPALLRQLVSPPPVESVAGEAELRDLLRRLDASPPERIWFFRNSHDVTPARLNLRLERELAARYHVRRWTYLEYSSVERTLMRLLGVPDPPRHFCELVRFDRP